MTIIVPDLPKGFKNWWSDPSRGIKKIFTDIAGEVNGLVLGGITADSFYTADVRTIAVNTTLTELAQVTEVTASNAGLTLTLPATSAATIFDGGTYFVRNAGATHGFAIHNTGGGTILGELKPDELLILRCTADGTANGTWKYNILSGRLSSSPGRQEIPVPASAMSPSATNGCAPLAKNSIGGKTILTLDFDPSTQEYAEFSVPLPKQWDGNSDISAQFLWSHAAATDDRVVWSIEAVAIGDGAALSTAFGSAEVIADGASTGGLADREYVSSFTPVGVMGGSPAAGDMLYCRVSRVVGNAADVMAVDARLHGIRLAVTTSLANDNL